MRVLLTCLIYCGIIVLYAGRPSAQGGGRATGGGGRSVAPPSAGRAATPRVPSVRSSFNQAAPPRPTSRAAFNRAAIPRPTSRAAFNRAGTSRTTSRAAFNRGASNRGSARSALTRAASSVAPRRGSASSRSAPRGGLRTAFSKGAGRPSNGIRSAGPRRQTTVLGRYAQSRSQRAAFNRGARRTNSARPAFNVAARRARHTRSGGYYERVARRASANYFTVPARQWQRMTNVERWRANKRFLDRAVERGDRIRLSTRLSGVTRPSSYAREIAYLQSRGFRVAKGGRYMVAPVRLKPPPRASLRKAFGRASRPR